MKFKSFKGLEYQEGLIYEATYTRDDFSTEELWQEYEGLVTIINEKESKRSKGYHALYPDATVVDNVHQTQEAKVAQTT